MIQTMLALICLFAPSGRAEADQLLKNGKWAEARTAYEALLEGATEPAERADLMDRIGETLLNEGSYWDAESWFSKSIDTHDNAAARYGRGRAYFFAGKDLASDPTSLGAEVLALMNDAARELKKALAFDRKSTAAWITLGYVEYNRQDPAASEAAFRTANELAPENPEAARQLAWFMENRGDLDGAARTLARVPEEARTSAEWQAIGRVAQAAGRREDAAKAWRKAVFLAPYDQDAYLGLWNATGLEKQFTEFNADMNSLVRAHPDSWLPHYYLGFSYRYDGAPDKAVAEFRKAAELNPDDTRPLDLAADVLLEQKKEPEAIDTYLQILERDPGNARALQVIAFLAYQKAQAKENATAERLYRALMKADPGNWSNILNLAIVLKETGRAEEAIKLYRETAEKFPFEPQIPNDLGLLLMGLGREKEAEAAFKEALRRDPEFLDSLENLGAFARLEGRLKEALGHFHRAYDRVRREGGDSSKFRRYLDMVAREIEEAK
jgi:tetratricopeptide (TPR) repeat protein